MFGFSLSRLQDFNYDDLFSKQIIPGYMYHFHKGSIRVGMILHLAGCLPAGLLMVLQFLPVIRHKYMIFHRINGYFVSSSFYNYSFITFLAGSFVCIRLLKERSTLSDITTTGKCFLRCTCHFKWTAQMADLSNRYLAYFFFRKSAA